MSIRRPLEGSRTHLAATTSRRFGVSATSFGRQVPATYVHLRDSPIIFQRSTIFMTFRGNTEYPSEIGLKA